MKQINDYSDKNWLEILDKDEVDTLAEHCYSIHKEKFDDDCQYIGNFNAPRITVEDKESRSVDSKSPGLYRPTSFDTDGADSKIERKQVPKRAAFNTLIQVHDIDDSETIEFFKNELNLKNIYLKFVKQEPGRVVATHVDYARKFSNDNRQRLKDVCVKDVSRFVYFLEDQKIGQMWSIGRNQIAWKAGDLYEWPWYMPHATANASEYDRNLLILNGY